MPPWLSSSAYLSPLLTAYDSRIKELMRRIEQFQSKSLEISAESDALMERNKALENELETKMVSLHQKLRIKSKSDAASSAMDGCDFDSGEVAECQQRLSILGQQNKLLRESEARWEQEKQNYLMLVAENKKTVDVLQSELEKVKRSKLDLEDMLSALEFEKTEMQRLVADLKQNVIAKLNDKAGGLQQRLKMEVSEHKASQQQMAALDHDFNALHCAHSALSEQCGELSDEKHALSARAARLDDELADREQALVANEKKADVLNEALGSTESVLAMYKQRELEHLKQINELTAKHDLFVDIERGKLTEENKLCAQQLAKLKQQRKDEQAELDEAHRSAMERVKANLRQSEQAMTRSIDELMASNASLSAQRSDVEQRCASKARDVEQLQKTYLGKIDALESKENAQILRVKQLELEKERFSEMAQRRESELTQESKLWKAERQMYNESLARMQRDDDQKKLRLMEGQETILTLRQQLDKLGTQSEADASRHSELAATLQSKLSGNEEAFHATMASYKAELVKLEALYNGSQAQTAELIGKHSALSAKWQAEHRKSTGNFSRIIDALKLENKALLKARMALQGKLEQLRSNQSNTVSDNESMNKKLLCSQRTARSLTEALENVKALNQSYRKKEGLLLHENKSLRDELSKTQISMQRWQRNQQFNNKINSH